MSNKTFFSYSRADSEFTRKLATDLRNAGADLWIDQLDIQPGTRWDQEIEKALKEAETVLVVLSPNAVASNNIMDEISYALENNKRVIPVIIKKCEIPFRLKRLQYIDFEPSYDEGFKRLSLVLNLRSQNTTAEIPKIKDPITEHKEEKILQRTEFPDPPKVYSVDTNTPLQDEKPAQKKKSSKAIYFTAGGVIIVAVLILLFNSHRSPDNKEESQKNSVDSASGTVQSPDSAASNVQTLVADSIKADSLYQRGNTELRNKNYTVAVTFFSDAAALESSAAMVELGNIFCGEYSPDLANFEKAIYWYRQGVKANNFDAMYEYGLFLNGNHISDYFNVPEEIINRDSAQYYWNICHNQNSDILRYKKTGP